MCFRDSTFKVFPTFPVIHRIHLEIFGSLLPKAFINQHGDPIEIYRRWGASQFGATASLSNTVGGLTAARYKKEAGGAPWRGEPLTQAIDILDSWISSSQECDSCRVFCLSVVLDDGLSSVHFLIIVDDPSCPHIEELCQELEDWSPNHLVRVFVNPVNQGASISRNNGMSQSYGDWTVLLDDDVIPQPDLLQAYKGSILRHPKARIFVGLTQLPPPTTWMQQALVASRMTFSSQFRCSSSTRRGELPPTCAYLDDRTTRFGSTARIQRREGVRTWSFVSR